MWKNIRENKIEGKGQEMVNNGAKSLGVMSRGMQSTSRIINLKEELVSLWYNTKRERPTLVSLRQQWESVFRKPREVSAGFRILREVRVTC